VERIEGQADGAQETPSRWAQAVRQFALRGLLLCATLFLIEVGLFFAVSSSPFFPGEHSAYTSAANQLGNQTSSSTAPQLFTMIFTNNLRIALIEMIPVFGTIFFAISIYATARVTEAIAGIQGIPAPLVLLLLFIFPYSYIELPAYAVATAEGIYLLYALVVRLRGRGGSLSGEAVQFGINLIIMTVMLAVAALFEAVTIEIRVYFWITWVPFIGLVLVVLWLNRRLSRIRREEFRRTVGASAGPAPPVRGSPAS